MAAETIKPLIAPFQTMLLKQGKCVGCFTNLKQGKRTALQNDEEQVECRCRRIYMYTPSSDTYRRAELSEIA